MSDKEEVTEEQDSKQNYEWLKPWQFQPGKSGNPGGRPVGSKSLKQFAKEYLQSLPNEEKLEYMKGMDKKTIWEMSEGKPKQDVGLSGSLTISDVLDKLDGPEAQRQELEDKPPVPNQE